MFVPFPLEFRFSNGPYIISTSNGLFAANFNAISAAAQSGSATTTFGSSVSGINDPSTVVYSNKVGRKFSGVVPLGFEESVTIRHGLGIPPTAYAVHCHLSDLGETDQVATLMVTDKGADAFTVKCVPSNRSPTALVDFTITEVLT